MRSTIEPPISVAIMSKYSIPAGITSAVEVNAKYSLVTPPVVNMWCAHTLIDSAANIIIEATNATYPNHRLCAAHRDRLGRGAEVREEHHVHDRMTEEPEQVLVVDRRR